jgi:hypothetical protein
MHADAANPRPIVAANDFKTTNLNGCAWLPSSHVIIIPKEGPLQVSHQHLLNSFGADIAHILRVQSSSCFSRSVISAVAGARVEDYLASACLLSHPLLPPRFTQHRCSPKPNIYSPKENAAAEEQVA